MKPAMLVRHGSRRRRSQRLSKPQVAGLMLIIGLCVGYVYFVTHSPQLSQVQICATVLQRDLASLFKVTDPSSRAY